MATRSEWRRCSASSSIAVLGLVYFLTIQLGLPDWVPWGAVVLLVAGLPIMIGTGLVERRRAAARATGVYSPSGETGVRGLLTWRRATGRRRRSAFGVLAPGAVGYTAMRLLGIGPVGTLVASGKLTAASKLMIADFVNQRADSTLGQSVTEAFRIDLAQSPVVKVLGASVVADALHRMNREPGQPLDVTAARELAVREGAKAVVAGEISPVGKGYVISAPSALRRRRRRELVAVRETAAGRRPDPRRHRPAVEADAGTDRRVAPDDPEQRTAASR